MPLILDCLVFGILALCLLSGIRKGFVLSLAKIAVLVLSFLGATVLSNVLAPQVSEYLSPIVESNVETYLSDIFVDGSIQPTTSHDLDLFLEENNGLASILQLLNISPDELISMSASAEAIGHSIVATLTQNITQSIVHLLLWLVCFFVLMLTLTLIAKALDLMASLPVLHTLNTLGGGAIGLLQGVILVYIALMIIPFFGITVTPQELQSTYLYGFFVSNNPLALLALMQNSLVDI